MLVSICTITYNRRPFIPYLIECIKHQTYKGEIEWIIVDDGTDKIEDLVVDLPFVKYFKYDEKLNISKKRNLTHKYSSGDIIIYFDDDDYYPPDRIKHAVDMLNEHKDYLIAGTNLMYIYYRHIDTLYSFGPYSKYHSTAATFAFRRELLNETSYNEDNLFSEETYFLKNYTIPLLQLEPLKTIIVFSHIHNSFDKKELLNDCKSSLGNKTEINIYELIKNPILFNFYVICLDIILSEYKYGDITNKPEIIKYINDTKEKRETYKKLLKEEKNKYEKITNSYKNIDININYNNQIKELKNHYEKIIENKNIIINKLMDKIKNK